VANKRQAPVSATLKLLSAGAVKRGVAQIAAAYGQAAGGKIAVEVEFTQVPKMRKRMAAGESADVLVATAGAMDEFAATGKIVPATRALLGRSRVGVVVHKDAPAPDVSDTEAFKRALLAASAVVHNDASSGVYIATLLDKLGLTALLGDRIVVVNSGAAIITTVAERGPGAALTNGAGGAIGMGQISEILVLIDKGCPVKLVAPLPDAIQNVSTYFAAASSSSTMPDAAAALVRELTSAAAKKIFAATGID
jgi:molybdate transport system substrate-binding protein